jgi:hypothetical protein
MKVLGSHPRGRNARVGEVNWRLARPLIDQCGRADRGESHTPLYRDPPNAGPLPMQRNLDHSQGRRSALRKFLFTRGKGDGLSVG